MKEPDFKKIVDLLTYGKGKSNTTRKNPHKSMLLYAILKGYKFSVGKIIENSILSYHRRGHKGLIPHPTLITRLCILGGMEGDCEEEKNIPRTLTLTLIGIIEGQKKKDKERAAKVAREEEENIEINQIQIDTIA